MECEASNPARGRVRFHHTFGYGLAEGRRGLAQGYLRILDLLLSYGRLDFLYYAFYITKGRTVKVLPLNGQAGSTKFRFL